MVLEVLIPYFWIFFLVFTKGDLPSRLGKSSDLASTWSDMPFRVNWGLHGKLTILALWGRSTLMHAYEIALRDDSSTRNK